MRFARTAMCIALLAPASVVAANHPFTFSIPDGWTDLSPGVPETNFANVHPDIVKEAKSGQFVAFAMDFRSEDGYYEGMNALVREGALTTDDDLYELGPQLEEIYRKEVGAPVSIVESAKVRIGRVETVRVVLEVQFPQVTLRQMQYLMPGGSDWYAVVTYSTVPDQFERYRPVFEVSANATVGLAQAKVPFSMEAMEEHYSKLGGAFVIFLVVALVLKQSLKKKQPPPRRGMPPRRPPPVRR